MCFLFFIGEIKVSTDWGFYPHSTSEHSNFSWSEQHFEENKNIIWFHTHNIISFKEERVPQAMGHHFSSSELNLFIILHKIASLW